MTGANSQLMKKYIGLIKHHVISNSLVINFFIKIEFPFGPYACSKITT